ncbi:MAG: MFS transporter [Gracilimonas sp.]|uniref:CynX/NimT family MFS transporter n=1 Tax=Gracilimonas TaxID=649462 RepID=UPI001B1B876F|nr:MFS transporter [Gracilimonas sp.]MBO6585095.1 MFS transporter [Gracilimonas sp.]MBO6615634.1 MFS transporter [Gracilimonas sp.]
MPPIEKDGSRRNRLQTGLLISGIILIALNLRPALASVGPLIAEIRESTGLSNSLLGLLTTLPLIAFGLVSMLTTLFTRRFGIEKTLFGALILLTIGILARLIQSPVALFGGTLMLGIAIALGNVLLPSLVKRDFPDMSGPLTSLYSSMMGIGASMAAGLSVPLSKGMGLGWRYTLALWSLPAFIALLIWIPQLRYNTNSSRLSSFRKALKKMAGSATAWQVAVFMGLQSLAFYVILAWLPDILQSRGLSESYSGWMLSLSQGTGVLGTLLIPYFAGKKSNQQSIVWMLILMEGVCLAALMLTDTFGVAVWVSVLGFALGGSFGLALLFIVLRSHDTQEATELSGMAQSAGYILAAIGPILIGALYDLTGNWNVPLGFLLGILAIKAGFGHFAGKPKKVEL